MQISIKIHFEGGLDTLFGGEKTIQVTEEQETLKTIFDLLTYIRDKLIKERVELFLSGTEAIPTLRPGILCLINDEDWELHDNEKYLIQDKDEIVFISTLHGG